MAGWGGQITDFFVSQILSYLIFFHPIYSCYSFAPLKNSSCGSFSPHLAFFCVPAIRLSAEPANPIMHGGVGGNDGAEAPVGVMTHYGGGIIFVGMFPPPRRCVPSGPAAFILPRRDCN